MRQLALEQPSLGTGASGPELGWLAGGLPRLLNDLGTHFQFDAPRADELRFQPGPGLPVARLPVWEVRGRWKGARLAALTGTAAGKGGAQRAVPPQVPEEVELVLGRQDTPLPWFPYRITFWQRRPAAARPEGAPSWQELFVVEFFHVSRQVPSDPALFDYAPGDQEVENLTPAYVRRLQAGSAAR